MKSYTITILTVGHPIDKLHSWIPEDQIPSHCRSQDRRCVW